jgi:hypothetical protein
VPQRRPTVSALNAASRWLSVPRLTLGLLVLGVLWRVTRWAWGFPIWGDEAFVGVNFITRDYAGMVRPLDYGQIVPLVFMWAELAISRLLGLSEWALRLIPTLASLAALLLFWRFSQRVLPSRAALLATAVFAAAYYVVRHGAELKPYSTDLLVSLGLTTLAWRVFERPGVAWRWVLLIFAAGSAVWCSYPAAFVIAAVGLLLTWLLVREKFPAGVLCGWACFGLVSGGSFLAMYLMYAKPHAEAAARLTEINMWAQAFPPLGHPLKLVVWLVAIHTGLMFAYPHGGVAPGSVVTFALVVVGAIRLGRKNGPLTLLLLGPLPATLVAAAMKAYPYGGSVRTSLYLAPAFCLLGGLGLYEVLRWSRYTLLPARRRSRLVGWLVSRVPIRVALQLIAAALVILPIGGMIGDARAPYQSEGSYNSRRAVLNIVQQTHSADRWVIFNAAERVDYAPYLGDWRGVGGQFVFDVLRFHPVPCTFAPPPDSIAPNPGGRVWLMCYRGPKAPFPEEQWARYLERVADRLGPAVPQQFVIKKKKEGLEALNVYRFDPPADSAAGS